MLGLVAVRKNAIIGGRAWAATNGAIRGAQKEKAARDCAALGREAQLELAWLYLRCNLSSSAWKMALSPSLSFSTLALSAGVIFPPV